ncbi:toprim domain-containing protein [Rhizobium rhizogenes]|uniref:toprim domain-containing protein n=1 Tax=Rhizobium rhizogenes TaxID=359 RepID=UPI0015726E67|nr:toprim domain-containing protein [Rhizobium rhizogenes]NTF67711.1 hypothetical protein [Rhizobium rhizogenes]
MTRDRDTDDIKQGLKREIKSLCKKLLPDGREQGRLWVSHNPVTSDYDKSPELKVALTRDIGAWRCWRADEKGDVIGLIQYVKRCDFREAMDFARDFLGIRRMTREQYQRFQQVVQADREQEDEQAEQKRLKRLQAAERLFHLGYQDGAGSAAEAYALRYFAARAIPLETIPNRDRATMRFSSATEYWRRAEYRNDGGRRIKVKPGPEYPAVHTAMRTDSGQIAAVHCTFLSPLGPKKLPVGKDESAKLMFGEAKGAMIRISHGPEGEPPETAMVPQPLILCEGIEDGLSLARACPEARVWAAGSLSAMASAPIWLPCVSVVIVAKDNDWSNRTAERQFERVLEAIAAAGKPITTIASHVGKDFNDMAQEGDEE